MQAQILCAAPNLWIFSLRHSQGFRACKTSKPANHNRTMRRIPTTATRRRPRTTANDRKLLSCISSSSYDAPPILSQLPRPPLTQSRCTSTATSTSTVQLPRCSKHRPFSSLPTPADTPTPSESNSNLPQTLDQHAHLQPIDFTTASQISGEESQILEVQLAPNQMLRAESGAMLYM